MKFLKRPITAALCAAFATAITFSASSHAEDADDADGAKSTTSSELRFIEQLELPDGKVTVVAEGDFEARSTGSYSVRLYSGETKEHPTDDFKAGLIRSRDGSVKKVLFEDINGDGKKDIVVIIESAGSGGFLSADAFTVGESDLTLLSTVEGQDPANNPVVALRNKLKE